jgi:integrase
MPTARLRTDAARLICPADRPQVYFTDAETQHLRLKVARSGRHVWDWRTAGRTEILGVYDPTRASGLSYQEAKTRADRLNAALDRGESIEVAIVTPPQVQTVHDLLTHYLDNKVRDKTRVRREKETARGVESSIKPLVARYGDTPVIDVNRHMLKQVVTDAGLAGRVAGVKLVKIYRAAWNFCQRQGVLSKFDRDGAPLVNPASYLIHDERDMRVKSRGSYKMTLPDEQIIALLRGLAAGKAAWDAGRRARATLDETPKRWPMGYLVCEFLIYTGCRKMEAETLYVSDLRDDYAVIAEHKTDSDGLQREIHLTPSAKRVLADAAELRATMRYNGPLVFPGPTGGEISAVDDYLTTACQIAGIKRMVVHSLRSIYINFCVRQGVPLAVASKNVGHSNIATTRQHYEAVEKEIRAQHAVAASAAIDRLLVEAVQQVV